MPGAPSCEHRASSWGKMRQNWTKYGEDQKDDPKHGPSSAAGALWPPPAYFAVLPALAGNGGGVNSQAALF